MSIAFEYRITVLPVIYISYKKCRIFEYMPGAGPGDHASRIPGAGPGDHASRIPGAVFMDCKTGPAGEMDAGHQAGRELLEYSKKLKRLLT